LRCIPANHLGFTYDRNGHTGGAYQRRQFGNVISKTGLWLSIQMEQSLNSTESSLTEFQHGGLYVVIQRQSM
jgi:hypothetical protein